MGQYHLIVNTDRQEYLDPYSFGDGAKLLEFGCSGNGVMLALAVLLSADNGLGGGDLIVEDVEDDVMDDDVLTTGSWEGDYIVIAGDYGEESKFSENKHNLYAHALDQYKDISCDILQILCYDEELKHSFLLRMTYILLKQESKNIRKAMGFKTIESAALAMSKAIKKEMDHIDSSKTKEYYKRILCDTKKWIK